MNPPVPQNTENTFIGPTTFRFPQGKTQTPKESDVSATLKVLMPENTPVLV